MLEPELVALLKDCAPSAVVTVIASVTARPDLDHIRLLGSDEDRALAHADFYRHEKHPMLEEARSLEHMGVVIEDMPWTHQTILRMPAYVLKILAATDKFFMGGPTVSLEAKILQIA